MEIGMEAAVSKGCVECQRCLLYITANTANDHLQYKVADSLMTFGPHKQYASLRAAQSNCSINLNMTSISNLVRYQLYDLSSFLCIYLVCFPYIVTSYLWESMFFQGSQFHYIKKKLVIVNSKDYLKLEILIAVESPCRCWE